MELCDVDSFMLGKMWFEPLNDFALVSFGILAQQLERGITDTQCQVLHIHKRQVLYFIKVKDHKPELEFLLEGTFRTVGNQATEQLQSIDLVGFFAIPDFFEVFAGVKDLEVLVLGNEEGVTDRLEEAVVLLDFFDGF